MIADPKSPQEIIDLAGQLRVPLDGLRSQQLEQFVALVQKWNRRFNLLSRQDVDRLWCRHILDSLSVSSDLVGTRVLDFGSGGGFPGIPLAIANPERTFTLLDRHQRKCRFLEQVSLTLGLGNVTVCCADLSSLVDVEPFDCITSRAVAPTATLWRQVEHLLVPQGRLVAMASAGAGSQTDYQLPVGAKCEQRRIPGLEPLHGVVIIDKQRMDG